MKKVAIPALLALIALAATRLPHVAAAADWPQWRYDAGRTATSPRELAGELHLQWVRKYPALEPAWSDAVNRDRMPYDRQYEPIVTGARLFVGSGRNDSLTALDTRTGAELWRFYADGPVRLPPVASADKVYFVSDDGHLYCLNTTDGSLAWKHRGAPGNRKILGNGRLVSAWPARGGPVLVDGTIYYAASIWPLEGVFIYAVDAATGEVVWANDRTDVEFRRHPHGGADAFGGLAPQGAMAAIGDRLIVPGGRSVPACLMRSSGKLDYFHLGGSPSKGKQDRYAAKREGGSHVCGIASYHFNHRGINTAMYDLGTGTLIHMWKGTTYPVLTDSEFYMSGETTRAYKLGSEKLVNKTWKLSPSWECNADSSAALIKAGARLYAAGEHSVRAIDLADTPRVSWETDIDGKVCRLIAADDRLFVVTLEGSILAFGADRESAPETHSATVAVPAVSEEAAALAESMASKAPLKKGYCLVLGLEDGELATAIAAGTDLNVIAVDPDADKVAALRRQLDAAGLYGKRISAYAGDPESPKLPPYLAVLTTSERTGLSAADVFDSMRPYGGIAYLPVSGSEDLTQLAGKTADLPGAAVTGAGNYAVVRRAGALPGSADWTHLNADVANTTKSNDKLVKLPLGVLWFGGNSHHDVLPRHAHGPSELVVGGRLFIEGINMLSARDVYTGQVLWRREFDDLGTFGVYYDRTYVPNPLDTTYNQVHIAGANARGANYAATEDKVYLLKGGDCLLLDPATGATLKTFSLPADANGNKPDWGYIGICEDMLIAGAGMIKYSAMGGRKAKPWDNFDTCSSKRIVVMDRHTGEVRWTRDSKSAFRHNAIVAGAGTLFCIDAVPKGTLGSLLSRKRGSEAEPELLALDIATGREAWSKKGGAVFGTWLAYSREHDLLLQCGRASDDMLNGEADKRMMVVRGASGETAWDKPHTHSGPAMLHGRTIYLNATKRRAGGAIDLLTGDVVMRKHPLTGTEQEWNYRRRYGCSSSVCGEHILAFRSGAAGFYDLTRDGGVGNLGGFKSSCTANVIPANGVLNAPDYTRTCTCSYQNQTSVALVHRPETEMWTYNDFKWDNKPVRRVGINFGAPGDRRGNSGTLWLDHAEEERDVGPSPNIPVDIDGASAAFFRRHSSRIEKGDLRWVGASGVTGMDSVSLTLGTASGQAGAGGNANAFRIASSADDAEEDGSGKRIAEAFDGDEQGAPVLCVDAGTRQTATPAPAAAASGRLYTVRLCFAEPKETEAGKRVFDVALQGKTVLDGFDIVDAAGGRNRTIVKVFPGIAANGELKIAFTARVGEPLLCGVEVVAE